MTIRNISYAREAFGEPGSLIGNAERELTNIDFDTMIGTGLSGSLVIPTLANALGKKWAIIRKEGDNSHGDPCGFEGTIGDRWVFVDDFIASGDTRERVLNAVSRIIRNEGPRQLAEDEIDPIYVGDYLYRDGGRFSRRVPAGRCTCPACLSSL